MKVQLAYLCLLIQIIFTVFMFNHGFFPTKTYNKPINQQNDDSKTDHDSHTSRSNLNIPEKPYVYKLVIMLIDALRYDFVVNDDIYMPYLHEALRADNSCLLKVRVEAPTVTMPRIKALMSGSIPGYSDIVMNFFEQKAQMDNLLLQAEKKGLLSVFYGDKTWLDLYPNVFNRSEGTTSFIVSDFTEVDNNVTKNLMLELNNNDWDIMILHYLGLDHIGHVEGPFSPMIRPKLLEMDNIVSLIHNHILKMNNDSEKVVFVICSDHGMKDTGGHGGTSGPEIFVPYVFLNYGCDVDSSDESINQIDITPLLSVLLGLPIPSESIGVLHYRLLKKELDSFMTLHLLNRNTRHLREIISQYKGSKGLVHSLKKAEEFLVEVILSNYTLPVHHVLTFNQLVQKEASAFLTEMSATYDETLIIMSIFIFVQVLLHIIWDSALKFSRERIVIFSLSVITTFYIFGGSFDFHTLCLAMIYFNCLFWECNGLGDYFYPGQVYVQLSYYLEINLRRYLLLTVLIIHLITLGSSSYIEEEHLFWYYIFSTYLFLKSLKNKRVLLLMIFHLIFRYMNSTGIKYANSPNIGGWLNAEHNSTWLMLFFLTGMLFTFGWCCKLVLRSRDSHRKPDLLFVTILAISVSLLKINHNFVSEPFLPVNGHFMGYSIIWSLTTVRMLLYLYYTEPNRVFHPFHVERYRSSVVHFVDGILYSTVFQLCLTLKPHNIFIIPFILTNSNLIKKVWNMNIMVLYSYHIILGTVCYFYQGNSNNIATIDVAVGFIGHHNPSMLLSGYLIFLNTFASQILSTVVLFRHVYTDRSIRFNDNKKYKYISLISTVYIMTYSVLVTFQRSHLFIWSVFSPKLLYLSTIILLYCLMTIGFIILDFIYFFLIHVAKRNNVHN